MVKKLFKINHKNTKKNLKVQLARPSTDFTFVFSIFRAFVIILFCFTWNKLVDKMYWLYLTKSLQIHNNLKVVEISWMESVVMPSLAEELIYTEKIRESAWHGKQMMLANSQFNAFAI